MQKTKAQRQAEILPVIQKLNSMHIKPVLNTAVKDLYSQLQTFINEGSRLEVDVAIEGMNLRILGVLEDKVNRKTWLKMTALEKMVEDDE